MTIETFLVKRPALHKGEIGLFPNSQMAEEDIAVFAMYAQLMAKVWSDRRNEALRYLWGLVQKAAENSDLFLDKDDAMDGLKKRVGFSKAVYDPNTGKVEVRAKSLKRISDEELRLLTDRIIDVICAEILPGIDRKDLRKEVEEWCGIK